MILHQIWRSSLLIAVIGGFFMISCKETDYSVAPRTANTGAVTDLEVNDWILDSMKTYYYWIDKMPANPGKTQKPGDFFNSLLYDYKNTANPARDHFSWIQESAAELTASLSGETKTSGMEFKLYLRVSGSSEVIGKVLYVLRGSPAEKAGIKRGDIFYKVNGIAITTDNYPTVVYGDGDVKTYTLATIDATSKLADTDQTKSVTATVFQADPVYLDSVYTIKGKTIGYLVYNQFVPGPNGSSAEAYDQKIDAIFAKFKAKGVNELVLDLRYNPGGYVSSAVKLASLIGKGTTTNDVFYRQEWNGVVTKQYNSNAFITRFVSRANSIGANLSQLYVLTTGGTASASELIINGLKPFMPVKLIGTATYGKYVGSISITDKTAAKRIKWGMQPIVFKSYNKNNESDFYNGFAPTTEILEYTNVEWKPLGDTNETLLNEAIFQITGIRSARLAARDGIFTPEISSSLERKPQGMNMFVTELPGASK